MKRLAPDVETHCALQFIKEFQLTSDQIARRYTVGHLDDMLREMGLPVVESMREADKALCLSNAIHFPWK